MDSPAPASAPAASAAPMEPATPGAILAAARVAQGYSIEDISQRLKLSPAQIKAIEADDHAKLPGPVFARGFIRSYARYLKLDGAQLLQPRPVPLSTSAPAPVVEAAVIPEPAVVHERLFEEPAVGRTGQETLMQVSAAELPSETSRAIPRNTSLESLLEARNETARIAPNEIVRETIVEGRLRSGSRDTLEPSPYRRVPALLGGVAVVVLGLAYYEFVYNVPATPVSPVSRLDRMDTVVSGVPAASAAVEQVESAVTSLPVADTVSAKPDAQVVPAIPAAPLALKKSGDPVGGTASGLHFVFNGESWVEVRDGEGNIVFSRTNEAGSERRVRAAPPLSVVVGGSSRVQLSYNGKAIDLLAYTREDVARLRLE